MRLRRLLIQPELLLSLGSGIFVVRESAVPKDTQLKFTSVDPMTGLVQLFIESEEFEDVMPGAIPLIHPAPVIERIAERVEC